jgi:RimJ/RimL family protein N-acetyltransferase
VTSEIQTDRLRLRASRHTDCVEIGWRLSREYWDRGYATEGAQAALRFGFETLELHQIVAFTVPGNLRSRRVMEKVGMLHDPAGDFDHPGLAPASPSRAVPG